MSVDPTAAKILGNAQAIGGRISVARQELLRFIEKNVPGAVALHNSISGHKVRAPKGFYRARQEVEKDKYPAIIVGRSVGAQPAPPGRIYREPMLGIYIIDSVNTSAEAQDDLDDLAEIIQMALVEAQGTWCVPVGFKNAGLTAWTSLTFQSMNSLPADWDDFNGAELNYRATLAGIKGYSSS